MANEQFSLCWDNFHTNMSSGLSSFLKSEDLVDVTLAVEGRYLKAHKMVLSVCSPYFKELFQVNPCQHPIVFMKDVSYSVMSSLLEFMYQGEVKVSQDVLGTFIKTAEALKIKGLTGDNQVETEPEAESTPLINNIASSDAITLTRKSTRERTPPRKKMLGPASKRFKTNETEFVSTKTDPTTEILPTLNNDHQQTITANDSAPVKPPPLAPLTTFKLEPEETAVSLANEEDISYDDSAMDDLGMDNTADYMMDSNDDAKAGTSSEVANAEGPGENQERLRFVRGPRGSVLVNIGDFLFKKFNHSNNKTYWRCLNYMIDRCPCSCTTRDDGAITYSGYHLPHNVHTDKLKPLTVIYEITFDSSLYKCDMSGRISNQSKAGAPAAKVKFEAKI